MLKIIESTTLTGYSVIEGLQVMSMIANITEDEVVYPIITTTILAKESFKNNFEQCKTDATEFMVEALTRQNELLSSTEEGSDV